MIYDSWNNRAMYEKQHPLFSEGFAFIAQCIENFPEPGTYEISGKDLFAKVQAFTTRQKGYYETHDQYIDIQYMAEGEELVYIAHRNELTAKEVYDPVEDVRFYKDDELKSCFVFKAGSFVIFFPDDAHKPSMKMGEPANAKKIVLKVRL